MPSWSPADIDRATAVFINCPFDDGYRPLFRAMLFTVAACGYRPRCALEISDSGATRITQIADLICACDHTIHDISNVDLDLDGKLPRFNMPLELGIDIGLRLRQPDAVTKRALILEKERHRYDRFLSDISGQDIEPHGGTVDGIIKAVRNFLNADPHRPSRLPGPKAIATDYALFLKLVPDIITAARFDPWDDLDYRDVLTVIHEGQQELPT